jgi:hypothetical protein
LTFESCQEILGSCSISPVPILWEFTDGFLAAYWRRPERYLDPEDGKATSSFAQLPGAGVSLAPERLENDTDMGVWAGHDCDPWTRNEKDFGNRITVAG